MLLLMFRNNKMIHRKILSFFLLLIIGCICFSQVNEENIKWINSTFGNFKIKIEPHNRTVMTPNLAMQFNGIFQLLRQNIPWLMPGEVNVEVYQDKKSFLYHNRNVAEDWSGAFFDPGKNIIVMYDEPKRQRRMMKKFAHELTHLFVENTFNPVNSKAPKKEPPVWLNEGLAVNMEDLAQTPQGGVWNRDLIAINIFSEDEHKALKERKKNGGLNNQERASLRASAVTDKIIFFKDFVDFMQADSYDKALQEDKVDDWYLQAYAMVRFLFRPTNSPVPAKRMQFEQFTKAIATYAPKKDENGKIVMSDGKKIMVRQSEEDALKMAYRYKSIAAFEDDFWRWLTTYQMEGRKKLKNNIKGN